MGKSRGKKEGFVTVIPRGEIDSTQREKGRKEKRRRLLREKKYQERGSVITGKGRGGGRLLKKGGVKGVSRAFGAGGEEKDRRQKGGK